jgi:hypothetical protein
MAHAIQISKADMVRAKEKAERIQAYAKKTLEKSKEVVAEVVNTIEVTAAAFAWGIVKGRWGEMEIFGAPLTLVVGLGLHVLGFFGVAGNMSGHLHAFANGTLASWATTTGIGAGDAWKTKAQAAALAGGKAPALQGSIPPIKGEDADSEIARAIAQG